VISVTVPLPLFDRGKAEMGRAEIARRAALARAEAIRAEVQLRLKGAWEETQTRSRVAGIYQTKVVAETGDLVRIARAAYEGGEVGMLELLDAYRTQREARLRMHGLAATARQSALELERLVGEEVIP
jgi:cobalt-zinc-cadmium efflux system outer membrane protein